VQENNHTALEFSPPISKIDLQQRAYVNLAQWHRGNKKANGKIIGEAVQHGRQNPKQLTAVQCKQGASACRKLLKEQKDNAKHLRLDYLHNR
jgi:hypothetical protein